ALIAISDFLYHNIILLVLFGLISTALIKIYLNSEEGRYSFDKAKLSMPIFGKIQIKSLAASFARTMTTLMGSGVEITEAIRMTGQVIDNTYVIDKLDIIGQQVSKGEGLYSPVKESGLFPPLLSNMVMLGEETGNLEDMLSKTADYFEEEVDDATE